MKLDKKIRFYKLVEIHQKLVKEGNLFVARKLLHFLKDKNCILGLGDNDYELETIFEKVGCRMCLHSRNGNYSVYL
ncbi:hypothetical protein [uncultured Clostridium sp.]|uniref:hypothetical protein n=1 Tax=uncultured Clostridium sp. TaxID=59620 RepID=UPI0028EE5ECF|nr:hypothetical protein [uncultured Clostridium sp.]